jgi:hypothetical protein
LKSFAYAAVATAALALGSAHATVVNISTALNGNPVTMDLGGGLTGVGSTLNLAAGTYTVTPVDTSFAGATFDAANRFGSASLPTVGWEWDYFYSIGGADGVAVGGGAQGGLDNPAYRATAADAFAAAPGPVTFTLASATDVTFYWLDDVFGDNIGGVSLDVTPSAVPEPGSLALMLAGVAALALCARRRRA